MTTIVQQRTGQRRSKRIAKAVPIVLSGSDIEGTPFSEQTKTLVLSRDGAGILSTKKLAPQAVLLLRCVETNREAAVLVVDQVGRTSEGYTYGVAFLVPNVNLWDVEFAPEPEPGGKAVRMLFECTSCNDRKTISPNDVELDVYAINKTVPRYCANCGVPTSWREVSEAAAATPAPDSLEDSQEDSQAQPASAAPKPSRPENRRKDVRAKVSFSACIRHSGSQEIVACENLSRRGFCFRCTQRYAEKSIVEVALPYSPGEPAIFFKVRIVWVLEVPAEKIFRCGASYIKA